MGNKERLQKRNKEVRKYVASLFKKYPNWKYDYIIEKTAEKYFLANRTIEAIVKGEGTYKY